MWRSGFASPTTEVNLVNVVFAGLSELGVLRLDQHSPFVLIGRVEKTQVDVVPLPLTGWTGKGQPLGVGHGQRYPCVQPQNTEVGSTLSSAMTASMDCAGSR